MSRNKIHKEPGVKSEPLQWNLFDVIRRQENLPQKETPVEIMLRERYPGISDDYRQCWYHSDELAQKNDERATATNNLVSLLEQAIAACRQLQDQAVPMTPKLLSGYMLPLSQVVHAAQDMLQTLEMDYPHPTNNAYSRMLENEALAQIAPKLLLNTEEQILIRTEKLPARTASAYALLLDEFEAFLHKYTLAHFTDWHCDFIHVHPTTNLLGIRDTDNYPYKPFIDALSRAVFAPDSYDHFSYASYNYPCDNITTGCYMLISKRSQKVPFFQNFENLVGSLEHAK